MVISLGTLDLGYRDFEKCCGVCGHINHYTADCPKRNAPKKKYSVVLKRKSIGYVEGRTEFEAKNAVTTKKFPQVKWKEISVRRV